MLLGFKRQFAPFVKNGTKTHTIRAERKDGKRAKPGEGLHCYVDPRQKTMELLGRWVCVRVETIFITTRFNSKIPLEISIDGEFLGADEANAFLWRDGFRGPAPKGITLPAMYAAARHWKKELKKGAFNGTVTHWDFKKKAPAPKGKR